MKEASGELNMTFVTIILIGLLLGVGLFFKDNIKTWVSELLEGQKAKSTDETPADGMNIKGNYYYYL